MVLGTGDIGHIMVESSSGRRGVSMKRTVFARFAFGLCENETSVFDVSKVISSNPLPSFHPGDLVFWRGWWEFEVIGINSATSRLDDITTTLGHWLPNVGFVGCFGYSSAL